MNDWPGQQHEPSTSRIGQVGISQLLAIRQITETLESEGGEEGGQ